MSSLEVSLITLICLVSGVALSMWLQYRLPDHHLSKESQDTVKLGAGMVATMSALVLGLLVSSAKSSFDSVNNSIALNGAKIIQLDRLLAAYGPETAPLRSHLKQSLEERIRIIWGNGGGIRTIESSPHMLDLQQQLQRLTPANETQRSTLVMAQQICNEVWQNRLLLIEQQQESLPPVFLALLVFWLTLLFSSFGLFAPLNWTVSAVLFVCAFSVSSAIFLIMEMAHPLDGIIRASSGPLIKALEMIAK